MSRNWTAKSTTCAEIINETLDDLDQVADFLNELRKFEPKHDDKLKALVKLLKTDAVLKEHKVLIFTEFAETARYLKRQLIEAGNRRASSRSTAAPRETAAR